MHYPVFVSAAGSNQTAKVRTTSTELGYNPNTNTLTVRNVDNTRILSSIVNMANDTIDCSQGNFFRRTINANSSFSFSNVPADRAYSLTLELTHTSGIIAFPPQVVWPEDIAPSVVSGKTHLFIFVTNSGGTRWRGALLKNYTN